MDPYMAWTLGGSMVPTMSPGSESAKSPVKSVDTGGDDDLDEQLKRLEFLERKYFTPRMMRFNLVSERFR